MKLPHLNSGFLVDQSVYSQLTAQVVERLRELDLLIEFTRRDLTAEIVGGTGLSPRERTDTANRGSDAN